ncbi:hypothetical protein ACDH70_00730 [Xanthomonas axonopodis pv. poinsettiicola]|uniref:hypothetical protein n=1 Tax=Xanthomonas TaxID=338 RepID=UPI001E4D161A|nr:hypothetical protein [Xanthomonas codiaei]MCC8538952.1 hypothetical protein [Xanthomonas codiaei]
MKIADSTSDVIAKTRLLIGVNSIDRPLESWYAYISRLIRCNLLKTTDAEKCLPADWIKQAFMPDDVENVPLSNVVCDALDYYKLQPAAWKLFPSLCSSPPECVRACPECMADGYHSYAMQDDLLTQCPVHGCPLSHVCWQCGVSLVRAALHPLSNAFRCPRGCSLTAATHSGLHVTQLDLLTNHFGEHLQWIIKVRETITLRCPPMYVAYPPHVMAAEGLADTRPSPGLLVALLGKLAAAGAQVPAPLLFQASYEGRWRFQVTRWKVLSGSSGALKAGRHQTYRYAFHRGAFVTRVPICSISSWTAWKEANHLNQTAQLVNLADPRSDVVVIELPSYLMTNAELAALQMLLCQDHDETAASVFYDELLYQTLNRACARRMALDAMHLNDLSLHLAEAFDALVRVGDTTWRVSATTECDPPLSSAWIDYREIADMRAGHIFVTRRDGPHY